MFFRSTTFSRVDTLEAAGKAQAKGRRKKAIACYLKAIEANSGDLVAHSKVAPLLAEARQYEKSWVSFRAAADGFLKMGFHDKSIGVYRLAARCMPKNAGVWEAIIRIQTERGHKADAVKTTLTAYRHFKGRSTRDIAISLLRKGWSISPWHKEVTLELARLHAKEGEKKEALRLLEGLTERSVGHDLRRVRGAILRVAPSPGALLRWVKTGLTGA
jgi:tetratricopeptide (TPR) repeat protein